MTHPLDGASALKAALWYATEWQALVAPADPHKKKPLIRTGKDHAEHTSRDPDVICSWGAWKVTGVRVAVITGPASGVLLLDADQHTPGIDGVRALAELEQRFGALPEATPRARTAHGLHVVTRYPNDADIRSTASVVAPGVDIRGVGGLFIAPPAPDRAWLRDAHPADTPLAVLPTAWVEALKASNREPQGGARVGSNGQRAGALILQGQRHSTLYSCAGRARRFGHTHEEILALLRAMNTTRCEPPLPDTEVVEMARDASCYRPAPICLDAMDQYLPGITDAAWQAVSTHNRPPFLFTMSGGPVRLESDSDGSMGITPLNDARLRHVAAHAAVWHREAKRSSANRPPLEPDNPISAIPEGRVPALPPAAVIRDMLACPSLPLPVLTRVVPAPLMAPDGSLTTTEGYDAVTRTYYAPTLGLAVPAVADSPSKADIARARSLICDDLLGDFPFVSDAERAHTIALLLLPFVREAIDGPTPLHLVEKPTPGTGATLLVDTLLFSFLGGPTAALTEGRDEDEWRKRLTAILRFGPSVVLIDNLRRRLDSAALSSAITSPVWTDRLLGATEMIRARVRCAWVATGNNPALSGEITRRAVRIRLDAKVDRPWLREGFRHANLRAWVAEHRGDLVWAVLTLARAWVAAGQPPGDKTLGMFERWAAVLGGILCVAGIPDFLENLDKLYEESDDEGAMWRQFVAAWWREFHDADVRVGRLWKLVAPESAEGIPFDLGSGSDRSQKTRFGKMLSQQRDRQYDRWRIERSPAKRNAALWRLRKVR